MSACETHVLPGLRRLNIFVIKNWSQNIPVNWLIHTNSRAVCFKCLFRLVLPPTLSPWGIFPSSVLSVLCFPFCWIINCVPDNWLTDWLFFLRDVNLEWCHVVVGSSPAYSLIHSFFFISHSCLTRQRRVACVLNVSHLLASKKKECSYSTAAFQSSAQYFSEKRVKPELLYWVSSFTRNCAWEKLQRTWRAAHTNWDFFGNFVLLQLGKDWYC